MNCRRVQDILAESHDGNLTEPERGSVAAHLRDCRDCRRMRDAFAQVEAGARALAELSPPVGIERRIAERWSAERQNHSPRWRRWLVVAIASRLPARRSEGLWASAGASGSAGAARRAPRASAWRAPLASGAAVALLVGLSLALAHREFGLLRARVDDVAREARAKPAVVGLASGQRAVRKPARNAALSARTTARSARDEMPDRRLGSRPQRSAPAFSAAEPASVIARSSPISPAARPAALVSRSGDLDAMNGDPAADLRQWAALSPDEWEGLEARVRGLVRVRDDFIHVPFPRVASASDRAAAAAVESYKREAAIVDPRLSREVTLQQKGTALSELCEHLRADTGIQLGAGESVADEKVTLFCRALPLRDVMRQLSRPFGYTWLRSGKAGEYRYELVQDLRSQLVEEELRNRDRNEALLALEQELEKYRPYLRLTPDEILAQAKTAPPAEKKLLENLGGGGPRSGLGYGPIMMYFRLSSQDMAALRAGQELKFSADPQPGERPLPPDIARGILQSWRWERIVRGPLGLGTTSALDDPDGVPVTSVPELRATLTMSLGQSELGQYGLNGLSGFRGPGVGRGDIRPLASGRSPKILQPDNETVNARFAGDPALRPRLFVQPQPSCRPRVPTPGGGGGGAALSRPRRSSAVSAAGAGPRASSAAERPAPGAGPRAPGAPPGVGPVSGASAENLPEPMVTPADVLEALHRASRLPIVADAYTRLYKPEAVSVRNQALFAALNRLADSMRLRWNKDGSWLQFRSTSFYDDRLKEIPNRLLAHWAAKRRQQGILVLDDLVEIAQLADAQLQGEEMAEGARLCYGLAEWDLARNHMVLPNLRFLAQLSPAQRTEAMTTEGLPFTRMTLAQQQRFLSRALGQEGEGLQSLEDLAGATVRVDYWQPGWYLWRPPGPRSHRWVVPLGPPPDGRRLLVPVVRERTPEAALQALRRVDPQIREAVWQSALRVDPRIGPTPPSEESQIIPTNLDLATIYIPCTASKFPVTVESTDLHSDFIGW